MARNGPTAHPMLSGLVIQSRMWSVSTILLVKLRHRHVVGVADIAVPYPVVVSLDLRGDAVVRRIGGAEFGVSAVVASFAVDFIVHNCFRGVGQN